MRHLIAIYKRENMLSNAQRAHLSESAHLIVHYVQQRVRTRRKQTQRQESATRVVARTSRGERPAPRYVAPIRYVLEHPGALFHVQCHQHSAQRTASTKVRGIRRKCSRNAKTRGGEMKWPHVQKRDGTAHNTQKMRHQNAATAEPVERHENMR